MDNTDHLIWSNYSLNYDDWKDELQAEYSDMTEEQRINIMYERNNDYLDDERTNLDIELGKPIIVIAEIGRWDGIYTGYRIIQSGNIKDCLYSEQDYLTWYVDKYGDLRLDAIHHDGTNHYLYRVLKSGITDEQIEDLADKIYHDSYSHSDLEAVTDRLGDEIGKIYGWEFPDAEKKPAEVGAR